MQRECLRKKNAEIMRGREKIKEMSKKESRFIGSLEKNQRKKI